MSLNNKNDQPFRYIYLLQTDGIGSQFIYISRLLDYVTEVGCKLIVDFRKMAFFIGWEGSYEESELNKILSFNTDRIIYSPVEIDRIISEHPNEVVGTLFYHGHYDPTIDMPFSFMSANDLLSFGKDSSCCLKDILNLVGEYLETFDHYQQVVSSCVGVHARLGNGEQYIVESRDRMKIPWKRFFSAMDNYLDDQFFICTDTPSFLEACIARYSDRVISLNRFMPPENCGPGHNIWSICCNDDQKNEYIKERSRVGPYRLLGEALIEMFLLGECKQLICNNSSFTHYARECCSVDTVILEQTKKTVEAVA